MAQIVFPAVVVPGSTASPAEPSSPSDGQIWVDTDGTAPTTVVTRWSKTPTNGTTTLSGTDDTTNTLAYTPGYEQVFLNGVLLSRTADYTATTGTSVVLTTGTVTSDIVEIVCPLQVAYTDTITTAAAATTYVAKALTTTTGDIIYASAANTPARLGIGSSAQVLTVSGGIPSWATPASNGMTLLSTTTLTGASVTLSSISGSYKLLRIFIELPLNATDSWDTKMCFNADTTANRHQNLSLATDTTGVSGSFTQTSGSITLDGLDNAVTQTLIDITIPDYANANTWKFAYATSLGNNTTTTTQFSYKSNLIAYNQTNAISSLLFKPGSGNFTSGTIYLYGVN